MPSAEVPIYASRGAQLMSSNGIRIREDVLYTDERGEESEKRRKRGEKALEKLREVLPGILEGDEAVLYVVSQCKAPADIWEQLTMGWYIQVIKAAALVFTNRRILHFGVTTRGRWKRTLKSVRWGGIAEAAVKGWISREMILKYEDGKKDKYWGLSGKDGKKVKAICEAMMPASRGEAGAEPGMVSLCPECRAALSPGKYSCGQCGLGFKDEKTLAWRTILIPGGAYFYTRVWFLGIASGFGDGIFSLIFLYAALAAMNPGILEPEKDGTRPAAEGLWVVAGFFLLIVCLQKLIAYRHGRRMVRTYLPLESKQAG